MEMEEIVLHIREDRSILLESKKNDGLVSTKVIGINTLLECVQNSIQGRQQRTGILPQNTLSVTWNEGDTKNYYVTMEFPDEYADITYMRTIYEHFPLPRLLFGFMVESSGRISMVNLGVPALGKLTDSTPMYFYPFSNVSRFSLCTGANTLPNMKSLQSLQNLPYYILSLPDNDDYYQERNNRLGLGHRDLMEHLRDKDRQYYYDHVLVPMPYTTVKNFL